MDPLTLNFWLEVGVAVLCGGVIGLERQLRSKPAGIRTNILICLGSYIFVKLSTTISGGSVDASRVLGQVAVGVGFLGGGVIIAREGHVRGITSAAVIWVLAGIGSLIGFGRSLSAITLAAVTVCLLTGFEYLEEEVLGLRRGERKPDQK